MTIPFDYSKIEQTIKRYTELLHTIINAPILTFDELSKLSTKGRGIYLVFDENELIYVGMTINIRQRLLDMVTSNRHSLNQIFLDLEMGDFVFKATGFRTLTPFEKKRLIAEGTLTKEILKTYKNVTKKKIKEFKFKFYETDWFNMRDLEHFTISILNPMLNQ